jgi:two-component sensor histidine kinase
VRSRGQSPPFPDDGQDGEVIVTYNVAGSDWKLTVSDNGTGMSTDATVTRKGGLGTSLVRALAQHLNAQIETASGPHSVSVLIIHGGAAWSISRAV